MFIYDKYVIIYFVKFTSYRYFTYIYKSITKWYNCGTCMWMKL